MVMENLMEVIDLIVKGGSLAHLVQRLAGIFNAGIIVTNPWGKILATSDPLAFPPGRYLPFSLRTPQTQGTFEQWSYFAQALNTGGTVYGYLLIVKEQGLPSEIIPHITQAAQIILLALAKEQAVVATERRYRTDFLYDLLYNNFESKEAMVARGQLWGWDLNRPHMLMVIELRLFRDEASSDSATVEQFQGLASTAVLEKYPHAMLLPRGQQLVIILPTPEEEKVARQKLTELFDYLVRAVARYFPPGSLLGGVGLFYPSASELYLSFQEAKIALEIGKHLRREQGLVFFADLGVEKLLYHLPSPLLEEYCQQTIGKLEEYDKTHGTNYVEVLESFFQFNGDFQALAQHFYLHPNTLRYRLQKIGEILGLDIHSLESLSNLLVALKARAFVKRWSKA
ncbi:CdaR family transcriptional regulator [Thermanaeromonas sp. C210]|nr:CdaR family transcriptional regulator [Thermanaeromonas sp. C210]